MSQFPIRLEQLRIASPCTVPWTDMKGDDKVRHCDHCRLHVYNLSAMTRADAERLVNEREGRTCVLLYRRADGTVLTQDCPVGLRRVRRKVAGLLVSGAAVLLLAAEAVGLMAPRSGLAERKLRARQLQPIRAAVEWLDPPQYSPVWGYFIDPNSGASSPPRKSG